MTFVDKILVKIDDISPAWFFWIYVGVWAFLLLLGYFLAGGLYVLMTALMLIASVIVVYKYKNPPITKNNSVFLIPLIGLLYAGIIHSGLLFLPELITDKSQAQVLTGVVPNEHEYVRGSGKHAKSHYYLTINGTRLHCDDDNDDDCKLVYAYKGQTATIYHYEGLAYEIEVGGQKIYEFNRQADKFKATQHKKMWQFIWAMVLFGIPSGVFFFINKRIIRDMEFISDEELKAVQQEQQLAQKLKSKQINSRIGAGGWAWRILFGLLGVFCVFGVLMSLVSDRNSLLILCLVMSVGAFYVAGMPSRHAKQEVAEYHALAEEHDMANLGDYALSGFYHYIGVMSWLALYVLCPLLMMTVVAMVASVANGMGVGFYLMVVMVVLFATIIVWIIKRAMMLRDWALE